LGEAVRFPFRRADRIIAGDRFASRYATAENLRLLKALTAAERHADTVSAELSSARVELARLRHSRAVDLEVMAALKYASKLCPGCGQAADDDGPDTDVLATDPTRQEPR
jgi:hypothetical protein